VRSSGDSTHSPRTRLLHAAAARRTRLQNLAKRPRVGKRMSNNRAGRRTQRSSALRAPLLCLTASGVCTLLRPHACLAAAFTMRLKGAALMGAGSDLSGNGFPLAFRVGSVGAGLGVGCGVGVGVGAPLNLGAMNGAHTSEPTSAVHACLYASPCPRWLMHSRGV
jgi:hypothetical protein